MYKWSNLKYGKLPEKISEEVPRNKLFVDLKDPIDLENPYLIVKREINNFNPLSRYTNKI